MEVGSYEPSMQYTQWTVVPNFELSMELQKPARGNPLPDKKVWKRLAQNMQYTLILMIV